MTASEHRARRYVGWLERRWALVLVASALAFAGAVYLVARHLPLRADFAYLLPEDAPAVRDLRRLEARLRTRDTVSVIVVAPSPEVRAAAMTALAGGLVALPKTLVDAVDADDQAVRDFFRARRHLFVPVADLERARDTLRDRLAAEKAAANPLVVDFEDDDDDEVAAERARGQAQLDELRARRRDAEARLDRDGHVSADGKVGRIAIRTAFAKTDATRGKSLLGEIDRLRTQVVAAYPGVEIGVAGGIALSVAEHNAMVEGMLLSSIVTALLVGLVLLLYLRSATLVGAVAGTLAVGTTVAFGVAALTVGHLNAATAFLGAIIAGNGVNYGILLVARYLEERRDADVPTALARAIAGTVRPTLVASLAAAIAYGSLAGTSFRGFADFAWIGAVGMVVCWVASFTLLPALILRFGLRTRIYRGDPFLGGVLVRLFGFRHPVRVLLVGGLVTAGAVAVVARYVAADPFEYDMTQLRSEGEAAERARAWLDTSDQHFGRGLAGKTFIAADTPAQVPLVVDALRAIDAGRAPEATTIGTVQSILDAIPRDQARRLELLAELRTLLDDPALEELDAAARAELAELRPPDDLAAITPADLPPQLALPLTERDGQVGRIVAVRPALHLNEWDGRDLIRFAEAVRRLRLDDGTTLTTSGSSVIFADIITVIRADGLWVTGLALVGLVLMVLVVVGPNRRAAAVLIATAAGTVAMVACCALLGIKVNFLDFVALPITLGLGVDYAINLAHRQHADGAQDDRFGPLRTSGSAVFLCSLTTVIGYGSLLVSSNLAIRGFGLAALIGEVTCLVAALALVPAIVGAAHGSKR